MRHRLNYLVPALLAILLSVACAPAFAQLPIADSSFLLEEAWRAESDVVQHSLLFSESEWTYGWTQEWASADHPLKIGYSIPVALDRSGSPLGDLSLDLLWQIGGRENQLLALTPRLSLLVPFDDPESSAEGRPGLAAAIPLTFAHSELLATHWNLRFGWDNLERLSDPTEIAMAAGVVRALGMNLVGVFEVELASGPDPDAGNGEWVTELTINPGIRAGLGSLRDPGVIPGLSIPVTVSEEGTSVGLTFHLMFEHSLPSLSR